jgi:hypothetical protein
MMSSDYWRGIVLRAAALACLSGLAAPGIQASHLPIFRFACENWSPAPYQAFLFQEFEPDAGDGALLDALGLTRGDSSINLELIPINPAHGMEDRVRNYWERQTDTSLPWLVICPPQTGNNFTPLWAGPPHSTLIPNVVDSPARRELVRRLLLGQSAVWVFLESGDQMLDEMKLDVLNGELLTDEKRLRQAVSSPAPASTTSLPSEIQFSIVRVTRNDPTESFFVKTLLWGETDDPSHPAAFPVFGRGRCLRALSGRDLSPTNIAAVCAYLAGPCATESKESNPGKDLLLSAAWTTSHLESPNNEETPAQADSTIPASSTHSSAPLDADRSPGAASTFASNGIPASPTISAGEGAPPAPAFKATGWWRKHLVLVGGTMLAGLLVAISAWFGLRSRKYR